VTLSGRESVVVNRTSSNVGEEVSLASIPYPVPGSNEASVTSIKTAFAAVLARLPNSRVTPAIASLDLRNNA